MKRMIGTLAMLLLAALCLSLRTVRAGEEEPMSNAVDQAKIVLAAYDKAMASKDLASLKSLLAPSFLEELGVQKELEEAMMKQYGGCGTSSCDEDFDACDPGDTDCCKTDSDCDTDSEGCDGKAGDCCAKDGAFQVWAMMIESMPAVASTPVSFTKLSEDRVMAKVNMTAAEPTEEAQTLPAILYVVRENGKWFVTPGVNYVNSFYMTSMWSMEYADEACGGCDEAIEIELVAPAPPAK